MLRSPLDAQTISIPTLAEASGGACDDQVRETWLGGVRLGVTRAQPRGPGNLVGWHTLGRDPSAAPVPTPLAWLSRGEALR